MNANAKYVCHIWYKLTSDFCKKVRKILLQTSKATYEEVHVRQNIQETYHIPSNFLKAVFYKIYLLQSWMLCPMCSRVFLRFNFFTGTSKGFLVHAL